MKPSRAPRTPAGRKTPSRTNSREKMVIRDPVEVFCRLRPVSVADEGYIKVIDEQTLQLATPDNSIGNRGTYKEIQYKFSRVFDESANQKMVFSRVALPLVENLLKGKSGLLFTYGVTGSGKTFTMTGTPRDQGILPRCLDVLFNSIAGYQAKKFLFKPDRMNGFDIQSDVEALKDRQIELVSNIDAPPRSTRIDYPKTPRRRMQEWDEGVRIPETSRINIEDEDVVYAVFATYVEVYNNCVYDLLDEPADDATRLKPPQPRLVREDANHNMYAHGVVEVEVSSAKEAVDLYNRGLKRKTMAHTVLNAESSRSHAVFTLRLVQAPLDGNGEDVVRDRSVITVSQLSLVDLAGSERTNRSKTQGARLREAGNINNSLLTLRMCFEILRDNQANAGNGPPKMVPFRESRLTHLFKNYFDGEGQVRMIVCVNPNPNDYEETLHVMKFAEMSQEVQVTRPTPKRVDLGFTPGRRRANQVFKEAVNRLEEKGVSEVGFLPIDLGIVYSLGGVFPQCDLKDPGQDLLIRSLMMVLEQRVATRTTLQEQYKQKCESVRAAIVNMEKELIQLKQENACLRAKMESDQEGRKSLEMRLVQTESEIVSHRLQLENERSENRQLRNELEDCRLKLSQKSMDSARNQQRMQDKIRAERDKVSREMRHRLMATESDLKSEIERKAEKLRQVQQIVTDQDEAITVPSSAGPSVRSRINRLVQARSESNMTPSRNAMTPNPTRRISKRYKPIPPVRTKKKSSLKSNLSTQSELIENEPESLVKPVPMVKPEPNEKPTVKSKPKGKPKIIVVPKATEFDLSTGAILYLPIIKSPVLEQLETSTQAQESTPRSTPGIAVSNPRHRRSRSAGGGERWLDHRPVSATTKLLELPTILQPEMHRRKSVSKLTNPRDLTDPNTSKYCLTTQEQDSAGELETKLYKGDVLPTVGGGAQVVLTDVEILRQASPTDPRLSPARKRSAENISLDPESVSERCKTGIEGHKRSRK